MILHVDMVLRTAAIGCRLKPSISSTCTYHTATQTPKRTRDASSAYCRRPILQMATGPLVFTPSYPISRYSSSISSPTSDQHAAPSASTTPPTDNHLNWNTFFKLRKSRRRYQLGGSVCTSLFGMVGGAQSLAHSDMDWIVGQIPLDPFITLGLITFSCGGVGWLLGPVLGTGIFNTLNRKYITQMATKEKEFYSRIKRYRVDPSASSVANPVPDYYGERISSVQGYRQWLKDQRAFNKKRQTFV